jgi:hypothetical protein
MLGNTLVHGLTKSPQKLDITLVYDEAQGAISPVQLGNTLMQEGSGMRLAGTPVQE